jgi:RNA polymerase sigma-70 factor (ECF subfamily)
MESPASLDQLYQEYAPPLFRFLIRLTDDEGETREVLQEIFIRLARSPRLLDGVEAPLSYLFLLARHNDDRPKKRGDWVWPVLKPVRPQ